MKKKMFALAAWCAVATPVHALDLSLSAQVPESVSLTGAYDHVYTYGNLVSTVDARPVNNEIKFNPNGSVLLTIHSASPTAKLTFSSSNGGNLVGNYNGTVPSGWANSVKYQVTFGSGTVGSGNTENLGLANPKQVTIGSVNAEITDLKITLLGAVPLVAGTYSDTLTVTISAT